MDIKTKKFQTILLVILGVGLALGLMIFSGFIKTPNRGNQNNIAATGNVVIWGPFSGQLVSDFVSNFNSENKNSVISYVAIEPESYDEQLLEAFARGEVPDIIILPHTLISRYQDKLIVLDETTLPTRNFKDLYSQGSEIFKIQQGTVGIPVAVDPLLMYYNRDMIESAGFINPPSFWNDDFLTFVKAVTQRLDNDIEISLSAVALGEAENIRHTMPIISTLAMQLGSLMVTQGEAGFESVLAEASLVTNNPTASSLEYFTNFSNPSNEVYSWNKEMPEARDAFAFEKSALYFGFASELLEIQRKNPNLNFDVTTVPQVKELNKSLTYGNFYALAIPKVGKNTASAFSVAGVIANGAYTVSFLDAFDLQPVRKDLLALSPTDPYQKIFFNAAIVSRAWITPNPKLVDQIFADMISGVTSGRLSPERAISEASEKINEAF